MHFISYFLFSALEKLISIYLSFPDTLWLTRFDDSKFKYTRPLNSLKSSMSYEDGMWWLENMLNEYVL